jgi:hypothetical protein
MNERIEELWTKVVTSEKGLRIWNDFNESLDTMNEKWRVMFAELIVQECANTVTDRCEMRNEQDVKRAEYHAKRIKEHFGVEE